MGVQKPQFAVLDNGVRILQISQPTANGFYFRAGKGNPSLKLLHQEVVVSCRPVYRGIALSGRYRVAAGILFLFRANRMYWLARHLTRRTMYQRTKCYHTVTSG